VPGISILQVVSNGAQFLGFNYTQDTLANGNAGGKNPFRDLRVREAIRYAIDVTALKTKVMRDTSELGRAMFSPTIDGWDARFGKPAEFDPAKARELLKQAGYPEGFVVDLDCTAQQPADAICQAISAMLAKIGIRAVYQPQPFNILLPRLTAGDTSMYVIGWNVGTAEAEQALLPLAHTRGAQAVGEYNFGGYSNPKVDALIDRGRIEFDPHKRRVLFGEAMDALDADAAFIPLVYRKVIWALRSGVTTIPRPNDILELRFTNVD
jgi:peptide/nickel transport system substrate-binding protein